MEDKGINYKVLWVDDDLTIVRGTVLRAELDHNIYLDHVSNWEAAKEKLLNEGEDYCALILDAHCKMNEGVRDDNEMSKFLSKISYSLGGIMQKRLIPWYIYSAGDRDGIEVSGRINNAAEEEERKKYEDVWGKTYWNKIADYTEFDALMNQIKSAVAHQDYTIVKQRHWNVFKYLGEGKLIDSKDAYHVMLKALSTLYFPDEHQNYEYEGNPIRRVLEAIFIAANKKGIIPDECMNSVECIAAPNKFMSGKESCGFKYGGEKDSIFPVYMGYTVTNIKNMMNTVSHGIRDNDKINVIDKNKKDLFFSYVLQLCDVIQWFGAFASDDENIKRVQEKVHTVEVIKSEVNNTNVKEHCEAGAQSSDDVVKNNQCVVVKKDGMILAESLYKMPYRANENIGDKIQIVELAKNTKLDGDQYPYFVTKYKVVK